MAFSFTKKTKNSSLPPQYISLYEFVSKVRSLLYDDKYIAHSDYEGLLREYRDTVAFFDTIKKSDLLDEYCQKHDVSSKTITNGIEIYRNLDEAIKQFNDRFVDKKLEEEKEYLDKVLYEVDPNVLLDEDQRKVVLCDEDYTLVIAGAGAGKTTTVAAKVKYLVDKQGVPPEEILVVSFTNKAVNELREKINDALGLNCVISTFHSIGNAILRLDEDQAQTIVTDGSLYNLLQDYFSESVLTDPEMVRKLVLFFSTYFEETYQGEDIVKNISDLKAKYYTTLKGDIEEYQKEVIDSRRKKMRTIQNEIVRSYQEVEIANFLYLHNIDYTYEPVYEYSIPNASKPYTPDFLISQGNNTAYLEHFGITEEGKNSLYSEETLQRYKKSINDKVILHRSHKTKLIYTFSKYKDGRELIDHLEEQLIDAGFVLKRKDDREVLQKIIKTEENRYVKKLVLLIMRFINLFKTNGYTDVDFDRMRSDTVNVRSRLFLDIARQCYLVYEKYLKDNNAIDFQDMINKSAKYLKDTADKKEKLRFRYVIVDEYQDISRQRFDLVGAIHEVCDAKVIAVGDDWQSIYAFSGSDIDLFVQFKEKMGYAKVLKIENTYRNAQEVIDIAGGFIQKNDKQIKKSLNSNKHIDKPVIIYTYDDKPKRDGDDNRSGTNYHLADAVEKALDSINQYSQTEKGKHNKILILGRYGFDARNLERSGLFEVDEKKNRVRSVKYPKMMLTFMTAHSSKGLGYDDVILINGINGTYGFPSKIKDDPILQFVKKTDRSIDYAEERRLFYVALTRTKNRVYCIAPESRPSEFLLEIQKEYKNVTLMGSWKEEIPFEYTDRKCPICGFPLQYKYKNAFGLRLYICTNEPEICGFMTNDLKGGKMQIMKCPDCRDGYLIVKNGNEQYFLGCTNFKKDHSGCNKTITKNAYYAMMGLEQDERPVVYKKKQNAQNINFVISKEESDISKDLQRKSLDNIDVIESTVLHCVYHLSQRQFFGVKKLTGILRGKAPKGSKLNYTDLPEFGALQSLSFATVENAVNSLINDGYLLKTKELYPVIHLSIKGRERLNKEQKSPR